MVSSPAILARLASPVLPPCTCRTELPTISKITSLFAARKIQQLSSEYRGPCFSGFQLDHNCVLASRVKRAAQNLLPVFADTVYISAAPRVVLEPLNQGKTGDISGSEREFLTKYLKLGIGSIVALDCETTLFITETAKERNLPCLVVSPNVIVPALSSAAPKIRYAIEEVDRFAWPEIYSKLTAIMADEQPSLYIMHMAFNRIPAEKRWRILKTVWPRLKRGDYLMLSGLDQREMESIGYRNRFQVDGIADYHCHIRGFQKSVLTPDFAASVRQKLPGASIELWKPFQASMLDIKVGSVSCRLIEGRRLVARKMEENFQPCLEM